MASMLTTADVMSTRTGAIKTTVLRLPVGDERNVAVGFEGLTVDEARTMIAKAIDIEQSRGGAEAILSPTEYGNRFSGLEFD